MGWEEEPEQSDAAGLVAQVSDYAIIGLDPQGTITTWNLGAEKLKGYTAREAIGRSFAMFYPEEDRRAGLPLDLLLEAHDAGTRRAHRLAGPQGRHQVLGRRGHHRPPRRAGQPHRFREGHPRPDRAARARGGASLERGAATAPGGPGRRLRHHRARPPGDHRVLEPRRRTGQGLHRRGGHRPQLHDVLHRRGPPAGSAAATARRGRRPGTRRAHRLAGPQGRHPVLGRRGHHRPPRRAGQPHRLRQGHPRPDRAARARGERSA